MLSAHGWAEPKETSSLSDVFLLPHLTSASEIQLSMDYFVLGALLIIMVDFCVETAAFTPMILVPSQTIRSSNDNKANKKSGPTRTRRKTAETVPSSTVPSSLIPSQVFGRWLKAVPTDEHTTDQEVAPSDKDAVVVVGENKRRRRRKRPQKKRRASVNQHNSSGTALTSGNHPDIHWRSIPMEHLRLHPRFRPLPKMVQQELTALEQCRQFRQESWQWEALHRGRCTTSQAVAALGFLEPTAGEALGVPFAWRRGGVGAFGRLRQPPVGRTLEELNRVLLGARGGENDDDDNNNNDVSSATLWGELSVDDEKENGNGKFAASYNYQMSEHELEDRMKQAKKFSQNEDLGKGIRMMWGNTQEATALLTALNYFCDDSNEDFVLEEVGMCGAGLELNTTEASSLLIGATPDGVLRHSDGRIEALEVKNHCPFFNNRRKNKHGKVKRFNLGSLPLVDDKGKNGGVFAHYVPQLQMEMLCLGRDCRSAVMVRQTANVGALVLRMHRDDEWIEEMVYWLHRFYLDFVEQNRPPPQDFFWSTGGKEDQARYRMFVNRTNEIRRTKVDTLGLIPNDEVQRMKGDAPFFLD